MVKSITISCILFSATVIHLQAQDTHNIIRQQEVEHIESTLAADALLGRAINTPGIEKAADFISDEFKKAGLKPLDGATGYRQSFVVLKSKDGTAQCVTDGVALPSKNIIVVTTNATLSLTEASGFEQVTIGPKDALFTKAYGAVQSKQNTIVWVDTAHAANFGRLSFLKRMMMPTATSVVFILDSRKPSSYTVNATQQFDSIRLSNVVGMLPGKTKPSELVIFSAHYDHIGIGKPVNGDSINNGANDDASGTTAVIMLAKHFKHLNNNNRTLVFAAFTAEESGGYGSRYFSSQLNPDEVTAMFNIEMIGTTSKWGANSAYITGFEKTDMGAILQRNLKGTGFDFYPDPYPKEKLFYRSDNATLARLGVPAHTISTSKMDNEPNYHKPSDEVVTLDLANMTAIIKAIAQSAASIINGIDTPSRVDTTTLE